MPVLAIRWQTARQYLRCIILWTTMETICTGTSVWIRIGMAMVIFA